MKILAKEIEIISVFKTNGSIEPIKFKVIDNDGVGHIIKVTKITSVTEQKMAGIKSLVFCCQSEMGNTMKLYELKYRIVDHKWELYKM